VNASIPVTESLVKSDEEHSNSSPSFFKRRAQALVCFVGCAIKHPTPSVHHALVDGGATNDLILTLIQLTTTSSTAGSISSHITEDISKVAEWSLNRTLNVMYAKDFIDASLAALECGESNVRFSLASLSIVFTMLSQFYRFKRESWTTLATVYRLSRTTFAARLPPSSPKFWPPFRSYWVCIMEFPSYWQHSKRSRALRTVCAPEKRLL
jgi:hypothetical protein